MTALPVAHLEVINAQAPCEVAGGPLERSVRRLVGGDDAAIDAERGRDQRVAEQEALDLGQRQHAHDFAATLREQVVRAVAESAAQHVLPFGEVEERAFGVVRGRTRSMPADRSRRNLDSYSLSHDSGRGLG